MARALSATTTTDEVLSGIDLTGKRVLVTGVSAGLGIETARTLASRGAHVIGTTRDLAKAEKAIARALADAKQDGGIELIELDLASLESVRACADGLVADGRPLDVVINNAGVAHPPFGRTADGFETQFGTNHIGHFVLTNRIAHLIPPGGRLVVVASAAHRFSDIDLSDLNYERTPYDPYISYGRSKTATILFAVEFDRRHKERDVRAIAVHPGVIETELARHLDGTSLNDMVKSMNAERAAAGLPLFRLKTIPEGAATTVWAGFVAEANEVGGRYCENCHISEIVNGPVDPFGEGLYGYAVDTNKAKQLWRVSKKLVGD
jgi:NAD(P)-dependent dehydrogenase (short-subunit alcohol dehydrogenase family)